MLCTITKMAVLGALGIERVIFLDRNDSLGQFYFYPYMVTTWNVVIRVTHKRVMKYIPTTVFVTRDELTSSFKIKNFQKKEKCEDILRIYRKRIEEENLEFNDMTADELVRRITHKDIVKPTFVDFVDYYQKWIKTHEDEIKGMRMKSRVWVTTRLPSTRSSSSWDVRLSTAMRLRYD